MDNYMKLMAVKGLIMDMDTQLYQYFQKDNLPENVKNNIVCKYFDPIKEILEADNKAFIKTLHKRGLISDRDFKELLNNEKS